MGTGPLRQRENVSVSGFEMESVPKPPPRRGHLKAHDGDMQKKEGALPALGQGEKVGFLSLSRSQMTTQVASQQWEKAEIKQRTALFTKLPAIPEQLPQKGRGPPQGKSAGGGQAGDLGRAKAAKGWRFGGEGAEKFLCEAKMLKTAAGRRSHPREATTLTVPVITVLSPASSEASLPEAPTYNVFKLQPPRGEAAQLLKSRPESFWSLMKEPQKKVLSAHSTKSPQPLPPLCEAPVSLQPHPPKGRPGITRTERPWPH